MCGRFTQNYTWAEIHAMYNLVPATPRNLQPRYNICPTQQVGVVTQDGDNLTYSEMRWWLVPNWWKKDLKSVPATFNARAETVATKPMFRNAFKRTRCLIPASGFLNGQSKTVRKSRGSFQQMTSDPSPSLASTIPGTTTRQARKSGAAR